MTQSKSDLNLAVAKSLQAQNVNAWGMMTDSLPDVVIADKNLGLVLIDINRGEEIWNFPEQVRKAKSGKLVTLAREVGFKLNQVRPIYTTIRLQELNPGQKIKLKLEPKLSGHSESESAVFAQIAQRFAPMLLVQRPELRRLKPEDNSSTQNDAIRIELDSRQAAIASEVSSDFSIVTGMAGSGKTLVLAARAAYLHSLHPNWQIHLVCFNNSLKPYLQGLVPSSPNIVVETFYDFITRSVEKFGMVDATEMSAEIDLERLIHISPDCDAILVDEAQDFYRAWITYLTRKVKPNRGGIMLAADSAQSIYRDSDIEHDYSSFKPQFFQLKVSYRSTFEITRFMNTLVPELSVPLESAITHGPTPSLIWADGGLKRPDLKRAVALDIAHILKIDPNSNLRDIGIICGRKYTMKATIREIGQYLREIHSFDQAELISPAISREQKKLFSLGLNTIKMLTVHSAKGLEFKYVFLLGLEEFSHSADFEGELVRVDADAIRDDSKLNFVGASRASHKLLVYYSKSNTFLQRLIDQPGSYEQLTYPDDYEVPTLWQS